MQIEDHATPASKPFLQGQHPTRRCQECQGKGQTLNLRHLSGLNTGTVVLEPCANCRGSGLEPLDLNAAHVRPERVVCPDR